MECLRCHNRHPGLIARDGSFYYCRRCCLFGRLNIGEEPSAVPLKTRKINTQPHLKYSLTRNQQEASQKALASLKQGQDVFVYAATGAGKTEMTFASISWYLQQGKKAAFAISRRQVVLEIRDRLAEAFPDLEVIAVCQGHTSILDGDLIVCTTHQLYRYPGCFDLLILDELDAFPYAGNEVLEAIARLSCKGQRMLLSATPDPVWLQAIAEHKTDLVTLFERPHGRPLVVPKVWTLPFLLQLGVCFYLCRRFQAEKKQVLVFVPTRSMARTLYQGFQLFFKAGWICSQTENKDEIMDDFRQGRFQVLFTTTLLERGITVPSVQVIVLKGEHIVFSAASLIQIFGRVGRSFKDPSGAGICLCQYSTSSIKECVHQIRWMNDSVNAV